MEQEFEIGVIPAKAGLSTAELVIHVDLVFQSKMKMDSRFRGNDAFVGSSSGRLPEGSKNGFIIMRQLIEFFLRELNQ